jgi:hypothetical protein
MIFKKNVVLVLIFTFYLYAFDFKMQNKVVYLFEESCSIEKKIANKVIQGFAFYNNKIFFSQTYRDKQLCLTVIDLKTNKKQFFLFNINSHPQDLSICNNKLFTRGNKYGLHSFVIKDKNILYDKYINLKLYKNTTTVSNCINYISVSRKKIYILNRKLVPIRSFKLYNKYKKHWIQGIDVYNNYIFILLGKNQLKDKKYLLVYNMNGKFIKEIRLTTGFNIAKKYGKKWELEGLSVKNNSLYTIVVIEHNKKILYKILELKEKNEKK